MEQSGGRVFDFGLGPSAAVSNGGREGAGLAAGPSLWPAQHNTNSTINVHKLYAQLRHVSRKRLRQKCSQSGGRRVTKTKIRNAIVFPFITA